MIIEECVASIQTVVPQSRVHRAERRSNYIERCDASHVEVSAFSKAWPCLLPQHGPGMKHQRSIVLTDWQQDLLEQHAGLRLRGLIHSDGCRFINTGRNWTCARYSFSNKSDDIRRIFCDACDVLHLRYTLAPSKVYVSRKSDVALLDQLVGPKR
jgi:non-ribosomal peptide synthetase component F